MKHQQSLTINDILIRRNTKELCKITNILNAYNRKYYCFPGFVVDSRCMAGMFEKKTNCFFTAE